MIAGSPRAIHVDGSACFNNDGIDNDSAGFCRTDRRTPPGAIKGQGLSSFDFSSIIHCAGVFVDVGTDCDPIGITDLTTRTSLPAHRDGVFAVEGCSVDPDAIGAV